MTSSKCECYLSGKLALVTGGGRGIGRGVCQVLARKGANVIAVALHEETLAETLSSLAPGNHKTFVANVASSDEVIQLFKKIKDAYGGLVPNIIVCCAGHLTKGNVLDCTELDFHEQFEVDFKGTFLVMKSGAEAMIDCNVNDGAIITISAPETQYLGWMNRDLGNIIPPAIIGGGIKMPFLCSCYSEPLVLSIATAEPEAGLQHYGMVEASKAAVETLTKTAAQEWAHVPIRCNVVTPGTTRTDMMAAVDEESAKQMAEAVPMKRMAEPQEIAEVICFLASPQNSYMTGSVVKVTGGYLA